MNSNLENAMSKQTEQAIVQAAGMESINNGMKSQGSATLDSNCSKRTTDMENVHGKTKIRSPECDIKYLDRLSETFIGGHCQMCHGRYLSAGTGVAAGLRYQ